MEPENCKCSKKGRNLVVCIDGTSNQFGEKNTNVVELYSKIDKTEDSKQLTYYNSGIGTYAKPSWKSVKYLLQVVDNMVDLAIAWNFEKIIMGAYRWLSDNYQENDKIFLFGFSRGAYQVRALAGMIQRVGLIHKGNEEQIPFAYELYATHTADIATCFKETFSRQNVRVHFIGVWDTVSSVGVIRGKTLPLTDSADHVCFFRHALALDERRVKFLPEYVHGGVCEKSAAPECTNKAEISETGLNASPRIKEVWFPGTHSDIGGGNQLNRDLDLARTPFLWMSFEAVSCGLRLRPTRVEWHWDHLGDMKESLTGVWHIFEWIPFKRLSYKDESSTISRLHNGRGRKIKFGQKVHASIAFCDESYHPKAILPQQRCLYELVGKGSRSNREWVKGWEAIIEMDIFDHLLMPNAFKALKSGARSENRMWVYRLTAMTSTDEGLTALRSRPTIIEDLVEIFTRTNQSGEVQECIAAILEKSSKGHASVLLSSKHCVWLLRVAREKSDINHRSFAVKLLAYSLSNEQSCEDIIDENGLGTLDEMACDEQHHWVTNGAFAMFTTILNKITLAQKLFAANTIALVRKRLTAEDSNSQNVAKCLFGAMLGSAENRQHLFDNDVLYSLLTKIDNWDATQRLPFILFMKNQYKYLSNKFLTLLTTGLCNRINDAQVIPRQKNILLVLRETIHFEGLRKRMWNSELIKALQQVVNQVGLPVDLLALALELYKEAITYGMYKSFMVRVSLQDELFDKDTIRCIGNALQEHDVSVSRNAINFFIGAIAQGEIRDKIFDSELVASLGCALGDESYSIRNCAVQFFTAAIAQEGFRDKIIDTELVTALRHALGDSYYDVRRGAAEFFTAAIAQEGFRDKIIDIEVITAFRHELRDEYPHVRSSAAEFFTAAIAQEGFRDKIINNEVITALRHELSDENVYFSESVARFFTAAIAQGDFRDKIIDHDVIAALRRALGDGSYNIRNCAVQFFVAAIAREGFRDKIFDTKLVAALRHALGNECSDVRSSTAEIFTAAIAQEGFRDKIIDNEVITALRRALGDRSYSIRNCAVKFFIAVIAQEGFWDKIIDTELMAALRHALGDENIYIRESAAKFFTAAIAQEGFRNKIIDTELVAALRHALGDEYHDVKNQVVEFFTAAIAQVSFRDKIMDNEVITALRHTLGDEHSDVRNRVVEFFITAIAQEGFRDKIIDNEVIIALKHALGDKCSDIRISAAEFFTAAIAQEGFWDKIIDTELVTALRHALGDSYYDVRRGAAEFFTAAIAQEGFRDKIIDHKVTTALGCALGDDNSSVRSCAVQFFTTAIAQEGFRDKIFDTEVVAALKHALGDRDVGNHAVNFFTAAVAQEGFRDKIFGMVTLASLLQAIPSVEFWSSEYVVPRVYNHFITSTLCEQLTSADLTAHQTRRFISEAIKYDDVHTRICTVELRKYFNCPRHISST